MQRIKKEKTDKEWKKSVKEQLKFRPTCILGPGCMGSFHAFSAQGHGLCQHHRERLLRDKRVRLSGDFYLEVTNE